MAQLRGRGYLGVLLEFVARPGSGNRCLERDATKDHDPKWRRGKAVSIKPATAPDINRDF
jgi:hypothetical protein